MARGHAAGLVTVGGAYWPLATIPVNHKLGDTVIDGRHSPIRTRMLGLIWLPVQQETTPTTTSVPLAKDTPGYAP